MMRSKMILGLIFTPFMSMTLASGKEGGAQISRNSRVLEYVPNLENDFSYRNFIGLKFGMVHHEFKFRAEGSN